MTLATHDFSASLAAMEGRDALLRKLRAFFHERGFLEVETPLLSREIIPELHIEPIQTTDGSFLQASPELYMKRLLAAGANAIFQITRSFRAGERGKLHNPEFTIAEWYRAGDNMHAGVALLDELVQSLLGLPPCIRTTYADVFQRTLGLCPHTAAVEELHATAEQAKISIPAGFDRADHNEWLNLLLAARVEPQLGRERPEIVYHYPASQASLARTVSTAAGYDVAERFELYYRGMELANGFHELADADEQRRRFEDVNAARAADGRPALPIPESLLAALEHGLPDCTGCALGIDRLAMLSLGASNLSTVMPFL